jgi:hypothetical protein
MEESVAVPLIRNDKWTLDEVEFIKNNYLNMSYAEMGKKLNRTRVAVMVKANRIGISLPEKYSFERSYFRSIDTEDKAYWLGFIYADGYIAGKYELGIELSQKDYAHLEKFKKCLSGDTPIKSFDKIVKGVSYSMCSLRLYSKTLIDDLMNFGLIPNKSSVIEFPSLKNSQIKHFVRGYFDGNGSLYIDKSKNMLRSKITCGSRSFIDSLQTMLNNESIDSFIIDCGTKFDLGFSSKRSTTKFLEYLYGGATIYLDRKYNYYNTHKNLLIYRYNAWNNK